MTIVASNDLKGLGATDGPPVSFTWTPSSALPSMFPWFGLAALLFLKPNRTAAAWWIFVPVVALHFAARKICSSVLDGSVPSAVAPMLESNFTSLAFGLAAVWLTAPYLKHRLRILTFLNMLGVAVAGAVLAFYVTQNWADPEEPLAFSILTGVCVFLAVVALNLAAMTARRWRPARLAAWLAVFTVGLWMLVALSFFLVAVAGRNGSPPPWKEFFGVGFLFSAACYVVLLAFFGLSWATGFYSDRVQALLRLNTADTPPQLRVFPVPEISHETAGPTGANS